MPSLPHWLRAAFQADWNVTSFAGKANKNGECALLLNVMQVGGQSSQILGRTLQGGAHQSGHNRDRRGWAGVPSPSPSQSFQRGENIFARDSACYHWDDSRSLG